MSIPVNGLKELNLNDPKLNINNNNKMNELNTKSFKISPKKENITNKFSPIKSPTNPNSSFNILPLKESNNNNNNNTLFGSSINDVLNSPLSASPIEQHQLQQSFSINDYKKKIKEITDLKIVNEDLIKELENLQDEINHKNQIIDIKSMKIDELMHENNKLLSNLKLERESNENDFNSWLDLKTNLELTIHNLKINLNNNNNLKDDNVDLSNDKIDSSLESIELNENYENDDLFNKVQIFKTEINKLKKKVIALRKENELEVQSKIMIMDELEMMRERYLEVDEKHEFLKLDYEDLVNELLLLKGDFPDDDDDDEDDEDGDNESKEYNTDITPTAETSQEMHSQGSNENKDLDDRILKIRKKRVKSKSSSKNSSEENSRISSIRNNSLNKAIRDVELKSQKQKYSQELMKYEFEIKSLKLQNEKLLSYIGFTLQVNGNDVKNELRLDNLKNFQDSVEMIKSNSNSILNDRISSFGSTTSTKTATLDNIEYSDAYNIRTAKKNLKTVIKSASALPIRPDTLNFYSNNNNSNSQLLTQSIAVKKMHRSNTNSSTNHKIPNFKSTEFNNSMNNNNNDNDSFFDMQSNSIDYSTDYNQGEIECIDIGGSDSFEEYGDDELDDDDENLLLNAHHDLPITNANLNELNELSNKVKDTTNNNTRLSKNKSIFTSTDSLNVSYKMNFLNTKNFKHISHIKTTPRTQLKRITPSSLNLKKKTSNLNNSNDNEGVTIENKNDHNNINDKREEFEEDDGEDLSLINGDDEELFNIVSSDIDFDIKKDKNNSKYFTMYQISEEDESEYDDNYKIQFSSSEEEDDDGDEDETFNISNQEIDMFKIDFLRKLYCPKHSMFQCFCRSMDLVNPLYFKIFSSPIYSLRRKLRRQYERKNPSLNSLKYKSKLLTTQNNNSNNNKRSFPMRYHRHERGLQQLQNRITNKGYNNSNNNTNQGNNNDNKLTCCDNHIEKGIDNGNILNNNLEENFDDDDNENNNNSDFCEEYDGRGERKEDLEDSENVSDILNDEDDDSILVVD